MTDVDDLVEAVFDIEDIVEEVADPEDLIEDFIANPLMILLAFTAALAGLLLYLVVITLVLLVLAFGPVEVLVLLMVLSFLVFVESLVRHNSNSYYVFSIEELATTTNPTN